jgi:SAM-dependent methyltransferase
MDPFNDYEDARLAAAYARLEFTGTYHLAYRDLPAILAEHVRGRRALDFGCGSGRSTRFLRALGFEAIGIDVSEAMLAQARALDPAGDYRRIADGDFSGLAPGAFDLAFCSFPFDNIPTMERKVALFSGLRDRLAPRGRIVNLVSTPDIYLHEWASFSTRDYPENANARAGDVVRIVNRDIAHAEPVEDIVWPDEAYRDTYARAGLEVERWERPLGRADEPFAWVNETRIAPWSIYVLRRARQPAGSGG